MAKLEHLMYFLFICLSGQSELGSSTRFTWSSNLNKIKIIVYYSVGFTAEAALEFPADLAKVWGGVLLIRRKLLMLVP